MSRSGMGRILLWLSVFAVVGFGLAWPAVFVAETAAPVRQNPVHHDPVRFTDYRAEFVVDHRGRLTAVETITAAFPSNLHGIRRIWSDVNAFAPHTRQRPTGITAQLDGAPARTDVSWQDPTTVVARIGEPAHTLSPGAHVVTIRYTIAGVLDPGGTGQGLRFRTNQGAADPAPSVFFWKVLPSWDNEIDHAAVTLTLPGPIAGAGCSVGAGADERGCDGLTVAGNMLRLSASDLGSHTPITVRAGVGAATPPRSFVPWTPRFDGVLGPGCRVCSGPLRPRWPRSSGRGCGCAGPGTGRYPPRCGTSRRRAWVRSSGTTSAR